VPLLMEQIELILTAEYGENDTNEEITSDPLSEPHLFHLFSDSYWNVIPSTRIFSTSTSPLRRVIISWHTPVV